MKRTNNKISSLSVLFSIIFVASAAFTIVGIVFWFILSFVLKQGLNCIDSSTYSIYYYISIVAVTIGFGLSTLSFSVRKTQDRKKDISDGIKANTVDVLTKFNNIVGSSEGIFISEVLNDFAEEWSIDTISSTFVEDEEGYLKRYLDLIRTPKNNQNKSYDFSKSLVSICKNNSHFISGNDKPQTDNDYIFYFLKNCSKILRDFEPLCYEYCNDRVNTHVFESDVLSDIKRYFLKGYITIKYFRMESDLVYLRFSLKKEKNKDNMILEEAKTNV